MWPKIHNAHAQQDPRMFPLLEGAETMSKLEILSLGGGLQSTAIFCLSKTGKIPEYDYVIFADTGSEQEHTLQTCSWIEEQCQEMKTEYIEVRNEDLLPLHEQYKAWGRVPMVKNPRCTNQWKVRPIRRKVKELVDQSQEKPWANMHLGITSDEAHRARESNVQWLQTKFPLIELGWHRQQCEAFMTREFPGLQVKKSGCWHCHYQSKKEWAKLRKERPDLFKLALEMEEAAKKNGVRSYGLNAGRSIEGFDYTHTLEDFGFELGPGDFDCNTEGSCFL